MVNLFSLLKSFSFDKKEKKNEKPLKEGSEADKTSLLSQLPVILSRPTMDRLCFADQIRFNGICRRWLYLDQYRRPPCGLIPCLATVKKLRNETLQCQFYESSNVNPFSVDKIDLHRFRIVADCVSCSCKYGWLFFSMIRSCSVTSTSFLLYSSVTKSFITLPTFVHSKTHHYSQSVQAFSADPTSPDCVFLVLHYDDDIDDMITISTCHQGDREWTSREYDRGDINFMCFGSTPIYLHGSFYFVSSAGEVASYNIALEEWKAVRNLFNGITHCNTGYEAFELNGELGLIYFYDDKCMKSNDHEKLGYISMFDQSEKIWVRLESLGDQALYVSSNTFSVAAVEEEARNNGALPNKIYRLDNRGCISVYSLENGDLIKFNNCAGGTNREKVSNAWKNLAFWVEPRDQLEKQRQSRTIESVSVRYHLIRE